MNAAQYHRTPEFSLLWNSFNTHYDSFEEKYELPPEIEGKATDAIGVANIEYSIDGGSNWLPPPPVRCGIVRYLLPG